MDRDEALRLLRNGPDGVAEWNRRREAGEPVPDLAGAELPEAKLAFANLRHVDLSNANLGGADLRNADLRDAAMAFANLLGARLCDAKMPGTQLVAATLRRADLTGADLSGAHLIHADLNNANLTSAVLRSADLTQADLSGANLASADLTGASLVQSNLLCACLRSANLEQANVFGVRYDRRRLVCQGIRADSCYGHAIFKRDVQDEDWIETFRSQSRAHYVTYLLWLAVTDCGRSLTRVWGAAVILAMAFGFVYERFPGLLNIERSAKSFWTPYYFSFVTFTTLGFGDVSPKSVAGEILVTFEVALGYVTLGVLVSILAGKVARRS